MLIGTFMHSDLVDRKLSTDQVSSVVVDDTVSDEEWDLVQNAVGLGLLFPNLALNSGDEMPERSGVFHLAYVLAPYFQILPRRGTARSLRTVIDVARSNSILDGQLSLFDPTRNEGGPS
jgi:hypothetical protein